MIDEELITVCVWCNEIVEEHPAIEVAVCTGCQCVEGETKEITLEEYERDR